MYKVYLAIFCLLFYNHAVAQSAALSQESVNTTGVINIAVSGIDEEEGDNYFLEAEKNERKGDLNDALTLFGKAAFEFNSSRKFSRYGAALMRLSNVHLLLEHYTEAEQVILNVALKNYVRIGSRVGQMDAYSQLGKIYYASNKLTQSLWFYTQQGMLAQQLKNNSAYIDSILGMARIKIKKKEYKLATKDLNKAELLAQNRKISQFKGQIKEARGIISERQKL